MSIVFIHATVTLDGFLADPDGGVDWMFDFASAPQDEDVVNRVCSRIGAVVGGANTSQTIEDDERPYGGMIKAPVFLMTHRPAEPVVRDDVTYTFVVDDIAEAVRAAKAAAGDKWVSLLGGRSRADAFSSAWSTRSISTSFPSCWETASRSSRAWGSVSTWSASRRPPSRARRICDSASPGDRAPCEAGASGAGGCSPVSG